MLNDLSYTCPLPTRAPAVPKRLRLPRAPPLLGLSEAFQPPAYARRTAISSPAPSGTATCMSCPVRGFSNWSSVPAAVPGGTATVIVSSSSSCSSGAEGSGGAEGTAWTEGTTTRGAGLSLTGSATTTTTGLPLPLPLPQGRGCRGPRRTRVVSKAMPPATATAGAATATAATATPAAPATAPAATAAATGGEPQ